MTGDEELDRLLAQFQRDVTELEGLRDQLGEVRGRAEAADGRVIVETTPGGALVGLTIDPRAMRLGSDELAAVILQAAAGAARNAGEQLDELVNPFIAGTPLDNEPHRS